MNFRLPEWVGLPLLPPRPPLLLRNYARAAGGAWLGAGPEGVRHTDGAGDPDGRRDDAEARPTDCAARAPGCARDPLAGAETAASDEAHAAAAANDANGNAPAGASPTSTAAHAAASLPRMPIAQA
jgi:hypothetical protein